MGRNRGLMIAGGLLSGLGTGITAQANALKERALRQMEIDAAAARQAESIAAQHVEGEATRANATANTATQIGAQKDINAATIKAAGEREEAGNRSREKISGDDNSTRRGLIVSTYTDDNDELHGLTAGGEDKPTGHKVKSKDLKAEEKLAVDAAIKASTEIDPETQKATVNTAKLSKMLLNSESKAVQSVGKMVAAGQPIEGVDPAYETPGNAPLGGSADNAALDDATAGASNGPTVGRGLVQPAAPTSPAADSGRPGSKAAPHKPMNDDDMARIQSGEYYIDPDDGKLYVKK